MGWSDHGYPIIRSAEVDQLLELLRYWYVDCRQSNGGLLHVELDDWNVYDEQLEQPEWFKDRYEQLPAHVKDLHDRGYLSRDITEDRFRDVMTAIIVNLRNLDEPERHSALAWHHGDAQEYLGHLQPWDDHNTYRRKQ